MRQTFSDVLRSVDDILFSRPDIQNEHERKQTGEAWNQMDRASPNFWPRNQEKWVVFIGKKNKTPC